jgi:hypothetical protein
MIALGSQQALDAQTLPNRHTTHGDAYRRIRSPRR